MKSINLGFNKGMFDHRRLFRKAATEVLAQGRSGECPSQMTALGKKQTHDTPKYCIFESPGAVHSLCCSGTVLQKCVL